MREIIFTARLDQTKVVNNHHIIQLPQNFQTSNEIQLALKSADIFLDSQRSFSLLRIDVPEVNNHEIVKEGKNSLSVLYHAAWSDRIIADKKNPPYLSFDNRSLSHISIHFSNERNETVTLSSTNPSFIRFKMRKVATRPDIHLYKIGSLSPQGLLRIDLPRHLNVIRGSWEMALSCVALPNPNHFAQPSSVEISICYKERIIKKTLPNPGLTDGHHTFWRRFREAFSEALGSDYSKISLGSQNDIYQFDSRLDTLLHVQFEKHLGYLLGVNKDFDLCHRVITIKPGEIVKLSEPINMFRRIFNGLMLKSSILQPSIFNGRFSPILRIIPITGTRGDLYKEFENLEFVEIAPSSLTNVDLQFVNEHECAVEYPKKNENEVFVHVVIRFID